MVWVSVLGCPFLVALKGKPKENHHSWCFVHGELSVDFIHVGFASTNHFGKAHTLSCHVANLDPPLFEAAHVVSETEGKLSLFCLASLFYHDQSNPVSGGLKGTTPHFVTLTTPETVWKGKACDHLSHWA